MCVVLCKSQKIEREGGLKRSTNTDTYPKGIQTYLAYQLHRGTLSFTGGTVRSNGLEGQIMLADGV